MQSERFWWERDLLILTDAMLDSFKIDGMSHGELRLEPRQDGD